MVAWGGIGEFQENVEPLFRGELAVIGVVRLLGIAEGSVDDNRSVHRGIMVRKADDCEERVGRCDPG